MQRLVKPSVICSHACGKLGGGFGAAVALETSAMSLTLWYKALQLLVSAAWSCDPLTSPV